MCQALYQALRLQEGTKIQKVQFYLSHTDREKHIYYVRAWSKNSVHTVVRKVRLRRRRPGSAWGGEDSCRTQRVRERGPAKRHRQEEARAPAGAGVAPGTEVAPERPPFQFKGSPQPLLSPWTLRFLPGLSLLRIRISIRVCILMLAESWSILSQFLWHQD